MIWVAPALPLRCCPISTKVAAPTATSTWVRKPPPRCRYCRSAPIKVPRTKAPARLTSESKKSLRANESRNATIDQLALERREHGRRDRLAPFLHEMSGLGEFEWRRAAAYVAVKRAHDRRPK